MTRAATSSPFDAVVVGAGPNGLTAAAELARHGLGVLVLEAGETPGGGCRSANRTLPGFVHDVCSAVHPMGALSPAFRALGLDAFGVTWVHADFPLAHPLPDGSAAILHRAIDETARDLGAGGASWRRLIGPFADETFLQALLHPVWRLAPGALMRKAHFGLVGLRSAAHLAQARLEGPAARALFAGCAAHSVLALDHAGTASFGVVLGAAAHVAGWPCARGGSQQLTTALLRVLEKQGGVVRTGTKVASLRDIPASRVVLFDLAPRQVAEICGDQLPSGYRARLMRFRHGPGIFKVDWALDGPIPWRNPACGRAMTVHVGGTFEEVAQSEHAMMHGRIPEKPFVLVAQQSLFDPTRAPTGRHTGWAYCHVPPGCTEDMTERIEAQVERFAPGFRDRIVDKTTTSPAGLETYNPTMIGGDMAGGSNDLRQFLFRPMPRWNPYRTPNPRFYLCSSSTPPGGGVHGMCGHHAARAALEHAFGRRPASLEAELISAPSASF